MTNAPVKAWICPVCGYIHFGAEPPEECPVCMAARDQFEPYDVPAIQSEAPVTEWRCKECGYIHYGSEPPEFCPVCSQSANQFEPLETRKHNFSEPENARKIVIVGAGIAGVSAAEAARQANPTAEIILLSSDDHLPYYRLNLTRYLAGELTPDQLVIHQEDWYREKSIQLFLNTRVLSIDPDKKEITLNDNRIFTYDSLVLTVGSSPFIPPFPGSDKKNVFTLRTIEDADRILDACRGGNRCVCIGGGLLGLETAGALARRGVNVAVLENQPWLMPRQLNEKGAKYLQEKIELIGIEVDTGVIVKEISGDGAVNGVRLENGTTLPARVVVISAGIRSNVELARMAGVTVNQGIVVDSSMRASTPQVFAAGDTAEFNGMLYGTWGPSQGQGTIAGMNAAGKEAVFASITRSNTLKVLGVDLFSIGTNHPPQGTGRMIDFRSHSMYASFIFDGNTLCGAILLDDISLASALKKLIDEKMDFSEILAKNPGGEDFYRYLVKIKGD